MKKVNNSVRYSVALIALLGLGIMVYLTYIHFANAQSFCDLTSEVSCDVVTTSIYSEVFGIPVSILGILYFGFAFLFSLLKKSVKSFQSLFFITLFALIPSLYLTLTEVLFIHSFCILCETSKVLMVVMLGIMFVGIKGQTKQLVRLVTPIIIAGIAVSGVVFFAQSGTGPQGDYTDLAKHMNEKGWTYYKSYTCSNCRRQERLLGDAYELVNSVECHPDGPGGQPELCLSKGVNKTPSWILEVDGQEVKRLEGLKKIDDLIEASGYEGSL